MIFQLFAMLFLSCTRTFRTPYPVRLLLYVFAAAAESLRQVFLIIPAHILPRIKLTTVLLPVYQIVLQVEERSKVMGIWTRPNGNMAGMIPG